GGEGWGEGETLTFAHDGKGSVRALFGAAAAIAQVFTYSAYGDLLAIHNGSGTLQPLTSSLTSVLYNGEGFDARTGLYNMRARWYSATNARWERLDPFNGNPTDPFSLNKYGFVHGDPVQGIDPTGLQLSVGGILGSIAIIGSWGAWSGYANYRANKSVGWGVVSGILGSSSMIAAKYTGKFPQVAAEAAITGAVASVFKMVSDRYLRNVYTDNWTIAAYFTEGFNWGATYAMWQIPRSHDENLASHAFGQSYINAIGTGLAGMATIMLDITEFYFLSQKADAPGRTTQIKERIQGMLSDHFEIIIGMLLTPVSLGLEYFNRSIPGFRGLPVNIKTEVALTLAEVIAGRIAPALISQLVDDASAFIADRLISEAKRNEE
ncbi:MAG: RHS repeat-associated core domain-containing protein, partial [Planctomycetota bacterium]